MAGDRITEYTVVAEDDVGGRIKLQRKRSGMTQEQLGKLVFVSRSCIANYEIGKRRPDRDMIMKLANIFQVSTEYMLDGKKTPYDISVERLEKMNYCMDVSALTVEHRILMLKLYDSLAEHERRDSFYIKAK